MQDHLQQTVAISQRRSQKTHAEQTASRTKGNAAFAAVEAATLARERQDEAMRQNEQRCQEVAAAETLYNEAIKRTLENTAALEMRVKTVTMWAESLTTTDADFFQTLLERQEETQRNLKKLYVLLCQTRSAE